MVIYSCTGLAPSGLTPTGLTPTGLTPTGLAYQLRLPHPKISPFDLSQFGYFQTVAL